MCTSFGGFGSNAYLLYVPRIFSPSLPNYSHAIYTTIYEIIYFGFNKILEFVSRDTLSSQRRQPALAVMDGEVRDAPLYQSCSVF